MTAGCVSSPATISPVAPPRLEMPLAAMSSCTLYMLPDHPMEADLDIGYVSRGANLVACDAARRLAVQTWIAERELQDRHVDSKRGWLRRWFK
jgi:hypothetical protein